MDYRNISIPIAGLAALSYDIEPGEVLDQILISGSGTTPDGNDPLGLLLFTNAYRSPRKTGSSTRGSEAIVISHESIVLPQQVTADVLEYPVPTLFNGPSCLWQTAIASCSDRTLRDTAVASFYDSDKNTIRYDGDAQHLRLLQFSATTCPEFPLPRLNGTTPFPQINVPSPVNTTANDQFSDPSRAPVPLRANQQDTPSQKSASPTIFAPSMRILVSTAILGIILAPVYEIL